VKNTAALYSLLGANAISSFAQGLSLIAIPWYFASILNLESYYARAFLVITFFTFFLSLYSGTIIDRYNRKSIFLGINVIGFGVLLSAAMYGFIYASVPPILAVVVLAFSLFTFQIHFPNLYAFGQEVVDKAEYGRFSALIEIQNQATIILSGVVAILLLPSPTASADSLLPPSWQFEPWELHHLFLLDAITYAMAFVIIWRIRYTPKITRTVELGSVWKRLTSGFRYLKDKPKLFIFGVASHSVFVILIIHGFYLINLYIDNYLKDSSEIYAISEVLYSLGALLAGFFVRKVFARMPPVRSILLLMSLAVVMLLTISFTKAYLFMFLFQFFIGIANAGVRVLRVPYLLTQIPNEVIGRTESIFNACNIVLRLFFIALFSLPYFSLGDHVVRAYFTGALFIALSALILWWSAREKNAIS
jgi:MFS transporter, DHA3 family, macrolide efflux protein